MVTKAATLKISSSNMALLLSQEAPPASDFTGLAILSEGAKMRIHEKQVLFVDLRFSLI